MSATTIKQNIRKLSTLLIEMDNTTNTMVWELRGCNKYHLSNLYPIISKYETSLHALQGQLNTTYLDVSNGLEMFLRDYIKDMEMFKNDCRRIEDNIRGLRGTIRKMILTAIFDLASGGIVTFEGGFSEEPIYQYVDKFINFNKRCAALLKHSSKSNNKVIIKR